jgi:hypothetical protein
MRINGHNVFAIAAAAVAMYAVGALIYGVLFSAQWMQLTGYSKDSFAGQEWRMALSPIMPALIAVGLSLTIKWRAAAGWLPGALTGFWMGLLFAFAARMYNFTYGTEQPGLLAMDGAHLILAAMVGGAILGAWK